MLKAITKDATRSCVSLLDPAIDHKAMTDVDHEDFEAAWRLGKDWRAHLRLKPGEDVTVFTIGTLGTEELNTILDETRRADGAVRSDERFWRLFVAGVRDIKPWGEIQRDPITGKIKATWLLENFIGPLRRAAISIGVYVLAYNQVTEEEVKNLYGRSKAKNGTAALSAPSAMNACANGAAADAQG